MKLLIKYPTRNRLEKSIDTLKKYVSFANNISDIRIIVSLDEDDEVSVSSITKYTDIHENIEVIVGKSDGKIDAINRDIPDPSTFDILLLASDDMIPHVKGYDIIIQDSMEQFFPDTDGVLFFNDGYVGYRTNTLVICGSKYYERFGYIYAPEYKSLFCDNEFTEEANRLGKQVYLNQVIIKHEHPTNNSNIAGDSLYTKNDLEYRKDEETYMKRFKPLYDISVLICTIPERHEEFMTLLEDIDRYKKDVKIDIQVLFDSRKDMSIGSKRNNLLNRATGKYVSFIDDDDKITPHYFKVVEEVMNSEIDYDSIVLNGRYYINGIFNKPFIHSIKYDSWFEDNNAYYRPPNHLNPIKLMIAKQIMFSDISHGEDKNFSLRLKEKDLIKTEYVHNKTQYLYYKKMILQNPSTIVTTPRVIKWGFRR